jgi:hypothetical protein
LALRRFVFIFLLERTCWGGKPVTKTIVAAAGVFRKGKNLCTEQFHQTGRRLSSFFYVLSSSFVAIRMGFFEFALRTGGC